MNGRLDTQRSQILTMLRQGPQRNTDLVHVGFRYSARIHELRRAGHNIKTTPLGGGVVEYMLVMP